MKAPRVCAFHGGKAPRALANAQAAIERADLQLRGLTVPAVDVLKRLLNADSESVILGAAKDILDRGGLKAAHRIEVATEIRVKRPCVKGGPKLDQSGGGTLDHPAARWRV